MLVDSEVCRKKRRQISFFAKFEKEPSKVKHNLS